MTITEFFSKDYLFNSNTPSESRLYIPLIALFGMLIVFAIFAKLARNQELKKVSGRYFISFLTIGILGFLYLFFKYEELPYLGSRFFLILLFLALFISVGFNSIWTFRYVPKHREQKKIEARYNKYLPKQKKQVSNKQ